MTIYILAQGFRRQCGLSHFAVDIGQRLQRIWLAHEFQ